MTQVAASKPKKNNGLLGTKRGPYKPQKNPRPRKLAKLNGLVRYFTGLLCKHGHLSERWTYDGSCVDCAPGKRRKVYEANKETILLKQKTKRIKNPEIVKERRKKYQANPKNKETKRIAQLRRHALQMQAEGTFTKKDIEELKLAQDFKCAVCGCDLKETGYHIDHKIPLSRGGSNWPSNLQLLCPFNNVQKSNATDEEYLHKLGLAK